MWLNLLKVIGWISTGWMAKTMLDKYRKDKKGKKATRSEE